MRSIIREMLLAPRYILFGAFILLKFFIRTLGAFFGIRSLFVRQIRCPSCHHPNPVHDRWVCGDCGAEYLGHVTVCACCLAAATWFACSQCRASIPLRWS
jgi:hypothetical protein